MTDERKFAVLHPLQRIHLASIGATLTATIFAALNAAFSGELFMARFTDALWLNKILQTLFVFAHYTVLFYAVTALPAALGLPLKKVLRYAINRPYPDRDRAPQLTAIGLAFGLSLGLLALTRIKMATKFWEESETPLYVTNLKYTSGAIGLSLLIWLVLRFALKYVPARPRRFFNRAGYALMIVCLALIALGQTWPIRHPAGEVAVVGQASADAPNILLITIDTLRADRLEPYGATGLKTPAAAQLAREGAVYEHALAPSPWTGPSFATIHSGQYPSALRLTKVCTLYGSYPTLAEHLAAHGYRTEAVVTNPFLQAELAFDRGFNYYEHTGSPRWLEPIQGSLIAKAIALWFYGGYDDYSAKVMTDRTIKRLPKLRDRRFFLWVHYMDVHMPYQSHEESKDDWEMGFGYEGPFKKMFWDFKAVRNGSLELTDADRKQIKHLYDQGVAFADKHILRLLKALDKQGLRENTLVIYTSDHGEELFDHGGIEHGHTLFQELLHIPLLMRWPGRIAAGSRIAEPVSLIDLLPTFAHAAGTTPPENLPGLDILGELPADRTLYAENMLYGPQFKAMVKNNVKLAHDPTGLPRFLFDLAADPQERTNIIDDRPELVVELHDEYNQWQVHNMQLSEILVGDIMAAVNLPEDLKSRLFSLGYTAGGGE
ncbi:MAG TPA: sulfatase [bacterium]|nr:sulfatase [bacterium]